VTDALDASDAVYIEVDPAEAQNPKVAAGMMLADGKTLKDILPTDLYAKANNYLQTRNIPMMAFDSMKVWALTMTLPLVDYMQLLATKQPLDFVIFNRAKQNQRETGTLETADEQMGVFEVLSIEEQITMLNNVLEELEKAGKNPAEKLLKVYLDGDTEALTSEVNKELNEEDPVSQKLKRLLLTDRDAHMADRIEAKMKANPEKSYFFAIGAAHLNEKEGVIGLLIKKGFAINRVNVSGSVPKQASVLRWEVARQNIPRLQIEMPGCHEHVAVVGKNLAEAIPLSTGQMEGIEGAAR